MFGTFLAIHQHPISIYYTWVIANYTLKLQQKLFFSIFVYTTLVHRIIKFEKRVGLGLKNCDTEVITLKNINRGEIKKHLNWFKNSKKKKLVFTNKFLKRDRKIIYR